MSVHNPIANLVSAMLTNEDIAREVQMEYDGKVETSLSRLIKQENIYAYTFATPNVKKVSQEIISENPPKADDFEPKDITEGFENIRNYANSEDFVTEAPLREWGYVKFGKTNNLGEFKSTEILGANKNAKANEVYAKCGQVNFDVTADVCDKGIYAFLAAANDADEYYNKKHKNPFTKDTLFDVAYDVIAVYAMKKGGGTLGGGTLYLDFFGTLHPVMEFFNNNSSTTIVYSHTPETYYAYISQRSY